MLVPAKQYEEHFQKAKDEALGQVLKEYFYKAGTLLFEEWHNSTKESHLRCPGGSSSSSSRCKCQANHGLQDSGGL